MIAEFWVKYVDSISISSIFCACVFEIFFFFFNLFLSVWDLFQLFFGGKRWFRSWNSKGLFLNCFFSSKMFLLLGNFFLALNDQEPFIWWMIFDKTGNFNIIYFITSLYCLWYFCIMLFLLITVVNWFLCCLVVISFRSLWGIFLWWTLVFFSLLMHCGVSKDCILC